MSDNKIMRAKMVIGSIVSHSDTNQTLALRAVCPKEGYPADGSDENNTYSKWTPSANLSIQITNPALAGKFQVGQEFYVDFTLVPVEG
jgi:hypothetical protein